MIHLPPEPAPGDKVSANAFRQLIRAVKSLRPIAGTGVRLGYGPNGTVINVGSTPRVKTAAVVNHGCFEIATYQPSIGSDPYPALVNRYYRIGHLLDEMSAATSPRITDFASAETPILALVCTADYNQPAVSLEAYADFSAIKDASRDESKAIYPLYLFRFDSEGNYAGVEIDFRNIPNIDITED